MGDNDPTLGHIIRNQVAVAKLIGDVPPHTGENDLNVELAVQKDWAMRYWLRQLALLHQEPG